MLIGGPPCQAYSIVGRARNQAKADYKAEDDHRHFLYKEYLRIIRERQPTVFVMENVKGILSAKVNDQRIFSNILRDLSDPHQALHKGGVASSTASTRSQPAHRSARVTTWTRSTPRHSSSRPRTTAFLRQDTVSFCWVLLRTVSLPRRT
ncbi:DNA cytosine methyltransferase [Azotobacter chroococcum]